MERKEKAGKSLPNSIVALVGRLGKVYQVRAGDLSIMKEDIERQEEVSPRCDKPLIGLNIVVRLSNSFCPCLQYKEFPVYDPRLAVL